MKFGRFEISITPGTKKGKPAATRVISKDHSIYPIFFNEYNGRRTREEVEAIMKDMEAAEKKRVMNIFFASEANKKRAV
jgi:hypothetical protein